MYSSYSGVDLILVGGGLQNSLIALAVLARHPHASVLMLERNDRLLGNHTWCYHAEDLTTEAASLVEEATVARWQGYDVRFPDHSRTVPDAYTAVTSDTLRAMVEQAFDVAPKSAALTSVAVATVTEHQVQLQDGRIFEGRVIIDARGPSSEPTAACAYQKFVGLELSLSAPTTLKRPVLMDACVQQQDGMRFFYVLPLGQQRVLVEDTYFSDSPLLDVAHVSREIERYAVRNGIRFDAIARTETGVLPLPLRAPRFERKTPFTAGYAGGLFHPATGYSLPVAMRLALHIASHLEDPFSAQFEPWLRAHASQFRFATLLNRLLFNGFRPQDRWNALSRFYRLPRHVIGRFYALNSTFADRARIVCGRPPPGISLKTLLSRGALA